MLYINGQEKPEDRLHRINRNTEGTNVSDLEINGKSNPWYAANEHRLLWPLTHSLIPTKYQSLPTFTRADGADRIATVTDHESVVRGVLDEEARFLGARRVENLASGLTTQSITVVSGREYAVTMKGATGATVVASNAFTGTLTGVAGSRITWDNGTPKTAATTTLTLTVTGTLTELQVEDVTGQSNQAPGPYVSKGVLSDPWHGANVDGVKCFNTTNGNSVDANGVVTEATGTLLTGLKGIIREPASTNEILYSEDWSAAAWAKPNVTVTVDDVVSPSGVANADKCEATATAGTLTRQIYTASDTSYAVSVYLKKGNFTQSKVLLRNQTTVTDFDVGTIDYDAGTISGTGWNIESLPNGWYRVWYSKSTGISVGDQLWFYVGEIGGSRTAGDYWYSWGAQAEPGTVLPTTYIKTEASSVTRAAETISIPQLGHWNNTRGSSLIKVTYQYGRSDYPTGVNRGIVSLAGTGTSLLYNHTSNGRVSSFDGTNLNRINSLEWSTGDTLSIGTSHGSIGTVLTVDGVSDSNAYDGAYTLTGSLITLGYDSIGTVSYMDFKTLKPHKPESKLKDLAS